MKHWRVKFIMILLSVDCWY